MLLTEIMWTISIMTTRSQVIMTTRSQVIMTTRSQVIMTIRSQVIMTIRSQVIMTTRSHVIMTTRSQVIMTTRSQMHRLPSHESSHFSFGVIFINIYQSHSRKACLPSIFWNSVDKSLCISEMTTHVRSDIYGENCKLLGMRQQLMKNT